MERIQGVGMQVVCWDQKPVGADDEEHPHNVDANERPSAKLHASEEGAALQSFLQSGPPSSTGSL